MKAKQVYELDSYESFQMVASFADRHREMAHQATSSDDEWMRNYGQEVATNTQKLYDLLYDKGNALYKSVKITIEVR